MPESGPTVGADTFAGLVADAVFTVESYRRFSGEPATPPDPAVLVRLRRGRGDLGDLDAWRAARGWDVGRLLDVLDQVLGISDLLVSRVALGATIAALLADSARGAGTDAGAPFPRLLRRSAYLPVADTPEAELLVAYARVVARALAPATPPPLALRITGLASDLTAVADDLEAVAKELRDQDALVLGGQVVHQRRLLTRMVDGLDGVATELNEGRLR
jgi:hypothetical protein